MHAVRSSVFVAVAIAAWALASAAARAETWRIEAEQAGDGNIAKVFAGARPAVAW